MKPTFASLDEIDRKIIDLLQEDGRMTHAALGKAVGLTAPSVFERVRKLEQRGVIRGYAAMIDGASVGRPLTAFIRIMAAADERYDAGVEALRNDPEILEFFHVAGEDCFLLKTKVHDPGDLEEILRRIRSVITVQRSVTMIAIATVKEHAPVHPAPLPAG